MFLKRDERNTSFYTITLTYITDLLDLNIECCMLLHKVGVLKPMQQQMPQIFNELIKTDTNLVRRKALIETDSMAILHIITKIKQIRFNYKTAKVH